MAWICKNQLGRRNLTSIKKKLLIGDRYEAEKMAHGGGQKSKAVKSTGQNSQLKSTHNAVTRKRIADESGTNESYVKRAGQYSRGVTTAEEILPGFHQEILSGKIKPTQKEIQALIKATPEERSLIAECLHLPRKRHSVSKAALDAVQQISDEMSTVQKPGMAVQDAVRQFEWKVTQALQSFDETLDEWPQLISGETYRKKIIATLQDLKQYILNIEGGTRYEWNCKKRKIV